MGNLKSRMTVFHSRTVISISHVVIGKISAQPHTAYAFSSLIEKTMAKTIHYHWGNRFVYNSMGLCGNFIVVISQSRISITETTRSVILNSSHFCHVWLAMHYTKKITNRASVNITEDPRHLLCLLETSSTE